MNSKYKAYSKKILENRMVSYFNEIKEIKYRRILKKWVNVNRGPYEERVCILLDKGLGDFLLFAPYLDILANHYSNQGKEIFLLCSSYNVKFLMFCKYNFKNIILIDDTKRKNKMFEVLMEHCNEFEIFILPTDTISKYACDIIRQLNPQKTYAIGTKILDYNSFSTSDRRLCLDLTTFSGSGNGFYSERHRALVNNLTGKNYHLILTEIAEELIGERMEKEDYYLINIGSSSTSKVWPVEHVIALIRIIDQYSNIKPIIVGNSSIESQIVLEKCGIDCRYLNLFDIAKTISLCKYSNFVITNDTGLYHLSVALRKSTYVLSAGSYIEQFLPYPDQLTFGIIRYIIPTKKCEICNRHLSCFINRKKGKTLECLEKISPQKVIEALKSDNIIGD